MRVEFVCLGGMMEWWCVGMGRTMVVVVELVVVELSDEVDGLDECRTLRLQRLALSVDHAGRRL